MSYVPVCRSKQNLVPRIELPSTRLVKSCDKVSPTIALGISRGALNSLERIRTVCGQLDTPGSHR